MLPRPISWLYLAYDLARELYVVVRPPRGPERGPEPAPAPLTRADVEQIVAEQLDALEARRPPYARAQRTPDGTGRWS